MLRPSDDFGKNSCNARAKAFNLKEKKKNEKKRRRREAENLAKWRVETYAPRSRYQCRPYGDNREPRKETRYLDRNGVRLNRSAGGGTGSARGLAGTAPGRPMLAEGARSRASGGPTIAAEAPGRLRSRSPVRQLAVVSCTMATLVCARSSCCRRRF